MNADEPIITTEEEEALEVARQAKVELDMLLMIERALRIGLQWKTRGRGNNHKLSTLRFHAWSFERHLSRMRVLADHGGYLHRIIARNPHLASDVTALKGELTELHACLEQILARLEHVTGEDPQGFEEICVTLERFLDDLHAHGQKESELLQHSFIQEEGGSG